MTPRSMARPLALLVGLTLLFGACGPAATPTPAATGSAAEPISQAPVGTSRPEPTFALPSIDLPSGDAALEELLPDDVGGETVQKSSMTGDTFVIGGGNTAIDAVLTQFDKAPSDLSVAFGRTVGVALFAYRLKGVDGSLFFNAFLAAMGEEGAATVTDGSYGGKAVKKVSSLSEDVGTVYVYTAGEVMYIVGADDITDALLNEAFSKIG